MASIREELIKKGYGGYEGWNDEAAIRADFQATGGQGKWDPSVAYRLYGYTVPGYNPNQKSAPEQEAEQLSPEEVIEQTKQELVSSFEELFIKKGEEFDENNPFVFDEALARASAEERYNPYYEAELNDFVGGIERQKESVEGEKTLLQDLNKITAGKEKRELDEAIRASEQGYAGAGLFFSGARERATGLQEISGQERTAERESRFDYGQKGLARQEAGIAATEATGRRKLGAERTTSIESDIAQRKAEEQARYGVEKAQYIGYPSFGTAQGLDELISGTFLS